MFSIRQAKGSDAGSLVEILNPIIELGTYSAMGTSLTEEQAAGWIRSAAERGAMHFAIDDESERAIGFQTVEPYSPWPGALDHVGDVGTFVRLDCHRDGVGSALTAATVARAKEKGFTKFMACVRADNPQAIGFYKKQGFVEIGKARNHVRVRGRFIDEVLLELVTNR